MTPSPHDLIARLTIDVTETLVTGKWTGIERVVRRVVAELQALHALGEAPPIRLVAARNGRFHALNEAGLARLKTPPPTHAGDGSRMARLIGDLLRHVPPAAMKVQAIRKARRFAPVLAAATEAEPVDVAPGEVVVLLDSYWAGVTSIRAAAHARRAGARVISTIYDLIPISHPGLMTPFMALAFPREMRAAIAISDAAIAISRTSAAALRQWLGPAFPTLPIGWFHLGDDPTGTVPRARAGTVRDYAMVGTVEPRKGHALVLDAFERRWAAGDDCRLTIVGRIGWIPDAMRARLAALAGEPRLRLVHDADDAALAAILAGADAVIMASTVEGFGLPLVEALALDIPVIASDIAIFREIAGEAMIGFDPADAASLVTAMRALEADPAVYRARARAFRWPSWRDAARQLLAAMEALLTGERRV